MFRPNEDRPDPQSLLHELMQLSGGRLKLYLGYTPGVGKTTRMLQEARRLRRRGVDLVVGWVETHDRPDTEALLADLEVMAPRQVAYQGVIIPELDLEAILQRRPATVLIDELAHTNAPGSRHRKRYEDVEVLLDAGVSVMSAMNIQHLESVAEAAGRLIGAVVHETVPDRLLRSAEEVQLVDASPEAVLERLQRGDAARYIPPGSPFLRRSTLVYLRELALRAVAEVVDADILSGKNGVAGPAGVRERVLAAVSTNPASARLIRRGARIAERLDAELFVAYVETGRPLAPPEAHTLQEHRAATEAAAGEFVQLQNRDVAGALIDFALQKNITQVIVGESLRSPAEELVRGSVINTLLRTTSNIDVLIVGEAESSMVGPLTPVVAQPPFAAGCLLVGADSHRAHGCGRHKIYLGAAPGVGKTFAMLQEAHQLQAGGIDVVCGVIETHGRAETAALIENLEVVPKRAIGYQGRTFFELDVEAVLRRRPAVVLVDELAHTNIAAAGNTKRFQDVEMLLAAGIDVVSTLNIQHLESLNTLVERTTGVKVRETLPDLVVEAADEVVLVDLPTGELTQRLREGKIYAQSKVEQALANFFRPENLSALRELALREVADDCTTRKLEAAANGPGGCVLVCINLRPNAEQLIRRGVRLASRLGASLVVAHIGTHDDGPTARAVERLGELTRQLGGEFIERPAAANQVPEQIDALAHQQGATLLVMGESRRSRWEKLLHGCVIEQVVRRVRNLDVLIVGDLEHD
ncbi:universal stress protein [Gloeobacter morelensis]|uniref:Universal stress protein n=1 Tax=Gloeobacter morelensis MG652769 TaxID=2781736 RepID=A0ABY3PIC2_9CYAN|nr:universal stress protein [Gloeobacter morelensis]UFP93412.1 universal stress protein [Gloeobacter morelensis MG652769]